MGETLYLKKPRSLLLATFSPVISDNQIVAASYGTMHVLIHIPIIPSKSEVAAIVQKFVWESFNRKYVSFNGDLSEPKAVIGYRDVTGLPDESHNYDWISDAKGNVFFVSNSSNDFSYTLVNVRNAAEVLQDPSGICNLDTGIFVHPSKPVKVLAASCTPPLQELSTDLLFPVYSGQTLVNREDGKTIGKIAPNGDLRIAAHKPGEIITELVQPPPN